MYLIHERHLLQKHRKKLKRANLLKVYKKIYKELSINPLQRTHHFEILEKRAPKPNLYSKRINQSNRVVYSVDSEKQIVTIFSAWGHYESGNLCLKIHHFLMKKTIIIILNNP